MSCQQGARPVLPQPTVMGGQTATDMGRGMEERPVACTTSRAVMGGRWGLTLCRADLHGYAAALAAKGMWKGVLLQCC